MPVVPILPVLYEDSDLIVVNKPQGIASIPERDLSVPSVRILLERQLQARLFTVHRLDKEVSGVLLFARSPSAHRFMNAAFFERRVKKTYVALVHGIVAADAGVINAAIRQFGSGRMGVDEKTGKPSVTRYKVLERRAEHTLVEAYPQSGRRHQIRVHLYHIGHPIVGDTRYGHTAVQGVSCPRLLLHALRIECTKPDGTTLSVAAPLPPEFS